MTIRAQRVHSGPIRSFSPMIMTVQPLRQTHKQLQHLRIIRRPEPRHRIPPRTGLKPTTPTIRITPIRNVIQHLRMLIQHRIHEPDGTLARRRALLVDKRDYGREYRRRQTRAEECPLCEVDVGEEEGAVCAHVGVAAARAVVDAAVGADVGRGAVGDVVGEGVVAGEVGGDGGFLVGGGCEVVGEAAAWSCGLAYVTIERYFWGLALSPVAKKSYGGLVGPEPVTILNAVRLTCIALSGSFTVWSG